MEAVLARHLPGNMARPGGTAGERVSSGLFGALSGRSGRSPCTTREKARDRHPAGHPPARSAGRGFHAYSAKHLDMLTQRAGLSPDEQLAVRAVATVLPFRTNSHVIENLIDWDAAPDDPIYRLVFPQPDMLPAADVRRLADLLSGSAPAGEPARRRARDPDAAQPAPGRAAAAERRRAWTTSRCPACSTSTRRRCCSSPSRARPATRTAPTASGGPSSWTSPT